jgi:hypothetical protein
MDETRILEIESNSRYRKYKELAHMAFLTKSISQSTLEISPIWIPLSAIRLQTKRDHYDMIDSSYILYV